MLWPFIPTTKFKLSERNKELINVNVTIIIDQIILYRVVKPPVFLQFFLLILMPSTSKVALDKYTGTASMSVRNHFRPLYVQCF